MKRGNVFVRTNLFFRQVIAELRKVIWPGRSDLITYTLTVVIFVAVIIAIVTVLDLGFAKLILAVFGINKNIHAPVARIFNDVFRRRNEIVELAVAHANSLSRAR